MEIQFYIEDWCSKAYVFRCCISLAFINSEVIVNCNKCANHLLILLNMRTYQLEQKTENTEQIDCTHKNTQQNPFFCIILNKTWLIFLTSSHFYIAQSIQRMLQNHCSVTVTQPIWIAYLMLELCLDFNFYFAGQSKIYIIC